MHTVVVVRGAGVEVVLVGHRGRVKLLQMSMTTTTTLLLLMDDWSSCECCWLCAGGHGELAKIR